MRKLVIISHTEHYKNKTGIILGLGTTVSEINYLADSWEEVIHVACLYKKEAPLSSLPYSKKNIRFISIPPYGGKSILDKFLLLFKMPSIILQVLKAVQGASEVQLRLPTSMGLFLLPLFSFFIKRKFNFWIKYAGNWNQENPPLSYQIQKCWLIKNICKAKVTINGYWEDQPEHCISFENPCLTDNDINNGYEALQAKQFNAPFVFTFIGRIEIAKGITILIDTLKQLPIEKIQKINIIGEGDKFLSTYKKELEFLKEKVQFHGSMSREKVHDMLLNSHFLLLPSQSEGFPKVIAEGACYGVIPIVSDVGSIYQYVYNGNGFLWETKSKISYFKTVENAIEAPSDELKKKATKIQELATLFTYSKYLNRLKSYIFE